ncbi:subtilisin-like protease SBT4.5 [Hibiscus syriacus]|uniref:subtilisin-like protease SBT4.5 n=1 Tax=Hibiscus syriacus TaxID=106335 RepID=UPI00192164CB|nr:subtilisin-like protease SBT4.5 [Hibiscus syriacus]
MGSVPDGDYSPSSHHYSMLQAVLKKSSLENYLIRSYRKSFNGFAAKLTDEEAKELASFNGVVSVFPNKVYHVQTTRSWDFMGFNQTVKRNVTGESNVIIGVIDTGIWPESDSFSDDGFGPPPKKWKGSCKGGFNFTCNNKLIGARVYISDSARDTRGHGTHTASTAAGNMVVNASFYGLAEGTARGGVPSARIAAYKVCDDAGCSAADILAAFDDAIADGVDLLTISLGAGASSDFYLDPIAIGAFHAAEKGILVIQAAGNSGEAELAEGVAPWMLSVAASTTDRLFIDKVVLGNGKTLTGFSVNSFSLNRKKIPLIFGKPATTTCDENGARLCFTGCLNRTLVKNKIVVCELMDGIDEAHDSGAFGSILQLSENISLVVPLPASALNTDNFESLKAYLNSTEKPVAEIWKSETIKDSSAPVVASFSSKGPNFIVPDILKPDISAPGVDILAAFSLDAPPSSTATDERRVKYSILSGTSMACPHVAAVAAYVKTFHPDWSPSAIKSALITTASPMDPSKNPDAEFGYGSGHVNPVQAINPGLVYDNVQGDNIRFLCSIGYSEDNITKISGTNTTCPKNSTKTLPRNFNYPSLSAQVKPGASFTVNFRRTVTNVGVATSTYNATIFSNSKLDIKVIPQVLSFKSLKEKKSYNVTVKGKAPAESSLASAALTWSDGIHKVRSPIVIHTYKSEP